MARLRVELPEGVGRSVERGPEDAALHIGRRSVGGTAEPVIVRWFETWAEGAPDLG